MENSATVTKNSAHTDPRIKNLLRLAKNGNDSNRNYIMDNYYALLSKPEGTWTITHEIATHGSQELRHRIKNAPELANLADEDGVTPARIIEAIETGSAPHSVLRHVNGIKEFMENRNFTDDNPC